MWPFSWTVEIHRPDGSALFSNELSHFITSGVLHAIVFPVGTVNTADSDGNNYTGISGNSLEYTIPHDGNPDLDTMNIVLDGSKIISETEEEFV